MVELLIPAGNSEKLRIAVKNGADAVYLGFSKFNARLKAGNFSFKELKEGIDFAHKNGVKVYVALNTLIKNNELNDFFETVKKVYLANADAVIIQEISFAKIIKKNFPDMDVHASTQARLQNLENLKYFDRVILPRELSKEEIKKITKYKIPLEIFVQGALCFSVSGLCLMSSMIGGRSGNRGICAQPCRKKYNGKFLMSMKDLSLIKQVDEIKKLGIFSVKVEGRLRSNNYVKIVTQIYRKALDENDITKKDEEILKSVFNRNLTEGFFNSDEEKISDHNVKFDKTDEEIYDYVNDKLPIIMEKRSLNKFNLNLKPKSSSEKGFYVKLYTKKDVEIAKNFDNVNIIFFSIDNPSVSDVKEIVHERGIKLFVTLPSILTDDELKEYSKRVDELNPDGILLNIQNASQYFKDYEIINDYGMNVFNDIDLEFYGKSIISPELDFKSLNNFKNKDFLTLVHGNLTVMTTKNKLPQNLKYDEKFTYYVIKEKDYYKVQNSKQITLLDNILKLQEVGITQFYFDIHSGIKKWLDIYSRILEGDELNVQKIGKGFTLGHFNREI